MKWIGAVKQYSKDWEGPSTTSQLCSRNFKADCFESEGNQFQEELTGIPPQKQLKPDTVPTIFLQSVDYLEANSSTSTTIRPLSKRRQ